MSNKVLATVSGREVTQQDVDSLLESLNPQQAMQFYSEEGKKRLLEELINQELLYLDALEKGLDQEDTYKEEVERIKETVLKQFAIRRLFQDLTITDDEIADFYNQHKEQFQTPESVSASHILVDDEDKAKEILAEIDAGLDFADAAKKYSKCPSNAKGGDLGYFAQGQMVPEFEQAAFSMEEGQISEPVKTQFGFHLIKMGDKKEAAVKELAEVKQQISQQLMGMKQNEKYLHKSDELKNKYEVKMV